MASRRASSTRVTRPSELCSWSSSSPASARGSWLVPTGAARPLTFVHAAAGFGLLLLTPLKLQGPVRSAFRSHRVTRWVSAAFGVMVLATIVLGVLHSTGTWFGVGTWSALWTHLLLGFVIIPFAAWHSRARRFRLRRTDLGRRAFLSCAVVAGAASVVVVAQEYAVRAAGLAGASRSATGSQELSLYKPAGVPYVSWLDDAIPTADLDAWRLRSTARTPPSRSSPTALSRSPRTSTALAAGALPSTGTWSRCPTYCLTARAEASG